jgi:uncharacterized protein (DUF2344 family)
MYFEFFKNRGKNMDLNTQAQKILQIAESQGVEQNFFFKTTFQRYIKLINYLEKLSKDIDEDGLFAEKTYIKGHTNKSINPAVREYSKLANEANRTVATLGSIIRTMASSKDAGKPNKLLEYIAGRITQDELMS